MKYHDPSRPRLGNGELQYCHKDTPIGALRGVTIEPNDNGNWDVSVMLVKGYNAGSWHEVENINFVELTTLLSDLRDDPEQCFANWFKHTYNPVKSAPASAPRKSGLRTLTLSDLE